LRLGSASDHDRECSAVPAIGRRLRSRAGAVRKTLRVQIA
jgi:hypothetical protein